MMVIVKERYLGMKTYYRFYFATEEILEYDTERVSYKVACRKAKEWAEMSATTFEYCGIVSHNY